MQLEYERYCKAFRDAGITPLSFEHWQLAIKHKPSPRQRDEQFDRDVEVRDGWAFKSARAAE